MNFYLFHSRWLQPGETSFFFFLLSRELVTHNEPLWDKWNLKLFKRQIYLHEVDLNQKDFIVSKKLFHLPCNAVVYDSVFISFDHNYATVRASPPAQTRVISLLLECWLHLLFIPRNWRLVLHNVTQPFMCMAISSRRQNPCKTRALPCHAFLYVPEVPNAVPCTQNAQHMFVDGHDN